MAHDEITADGNGPPGCPLDPVLSLLALKWLVHAVWLLGRHETLRFAELQGNYLAKYPLRSSRGA
jgi:DNA-binding HxlR family transcriptional regulator